jgi:ribonuclease HI
MNRRRNIRRQNSNIEAGGEAGEESQRVAAAGPPSTRNEMPGPAQIDENNNEHLQSHTTNPSPQETSTMTHSRDAVNCQVARPSADMIRTIAATKPPCYKCGDPTPDVKQPAICKQCHRHSHKSKVDCAGYKRFTLDKMIAANTWECLDCRAGRSQVTQGEQGHAEEEPQSTSSGMQGSTQSTADADEDAPYVLPTPEKCNTCTRKVKKEFLACNGCKKQFHKQEKCSGLSKAQITKLNRKTWICEGCEGIDATEMPAFDPDISIEYRTSDKKTHKKLVILQWNANSEKTKRPELKEFLEENNIDIFFLQETKLNKFDSTPKYKDYTILRQDRIQKKGNERNRGGGLLIGVHKRVYYRQLHLDIRNSNDEITESMTIEIPTTGKQKLRFTNIYAPPVRNTQSEAARQRKAEFAPDKWPVKPYDCIFGDVNAHSSLWDKTVMEDQSRSNHRGELLENWSADNNMSCINTGDATHTSGIQGFQSAPDTSFVHSSQLDKFTWSVLDDLGSDHKPIIIVYESDVAVPKANDKPKYKWRLSEAKWEDFTQQVEDNIPTTYKSRSLKRLEKTLKKAIINAANKTVGKKKVGTNVKPWLTKEIKEKIKVRNRLRKTARQNKKEYITASREVTDMVREKKTSLWKKYVDELETKCDPRQVWKTIRCLDGRNPTSKENEALVVNGTAYTSNRDKAKQFAKTYKSFSILPVCKEDRKLRRTVRRNFKRVKLLPPDESEGDITMAELESAIKEVDLEKAPGGDDITYEFLKHLGPNAKEMLLHMFNRCWKGEDLPSAWLSAIIKPLLKEGKDAKLTTSYRPISLTSCVGKIMEKIVANRLSYFLESNGLLSDQQAGFRPGRSTADQVLRLTQSATDQMHQKKGEAATLVSFYDCEKAFDKVWREGLLLKMQEMGIPAKFLRYVRNFLSGRRAVVEVNNEKGDEFQLNQGLPQGSCISPLLFIIFVNDIGVDLSDQTIASLFADDTATWTKTGKITPSSRTLLQADIDKILAWANKWKMAVNTDKTKVMVISSSTNDHKWDPQVSGNGEDINTTSEYKFLGVTVDKELRFGKHSENVVAKAKKRVNILKCMSGKDWGNSQESQRRIYLQYIRPCLEYASPGWAPWRSANQIQELERVQNDALRAITGMAKRCPTDFLRLQAGVEPLADRLKKNDEILWDKYARLPDTDARKGLASDAVKTRLTTRLGWRNCTAPRMRVWDIKRDVATPALPPWKELTNLTVEYVRLDKKKSDYTSEELRVKAMAKIASIKEDTTIYIDGSTSGKQEFGGAGVYAEGNDSFPLHEECVPAGRYCSSFTAEGCAFLHALQWIEQFEHSAPPSPSLAMRNQLDAEQDEGLVGSEPATDPNPTVLVCTDSMSLTRALESNDWRDADPWMKSIKQTLHRMKTNIKLLWIPSHCDIPGNDRADELADRGAKLSQKNTITTHGIVKAKIRNRKWKVTHERAKRTFGDRSSTKAEIERKWPKDCRSLFARLRSNHAKELKHYQHRLGTEPDALCSCGTGDEETIDHLLIRCPRVDDAREKHCPGTRMKEEMLVTEPERCRKILATLYARLRIKTDEGEISSASTTDGHPQGDPGLTTDSRQTIQDILNRPTEQTDDSTTQTTNEETGEQGHPSRGGPADICM